MNVLEFRYKYGRRSENKIPGNWVVRYSKLLCYTSTTYEIICFKVSSHSCDYNKIIKYMSSKKQTKRRNNVVDK